MTSRIAAIVFAPCSWSCSGEREHTLQGRLIPACTWPVAADSVDAASGTGCAPKSMFEICEVPSGSVVQADGSVITPDGGVVSCTDACSPDEYSLTCIGSAAAQSIPQPESSLNCKVIPISTPSNRLFYCCPCGT